LIILILVIKNELLKNVVQKSNGAFFKDLEKKITLSCIIPPFIRETFWQGNYARQGINPDINQKI